MVSKHECGDRHFEVVCVCVLYLFIFISSHSYVSFASINLYVVNPPPCVL